MSFESLPRLNSSQSALCKTLFLAPAFGNRLKCHKGGGSGEVREVMASFDGEIAGAIGSIRFWVSSHNLGPSVSHSVSSRGNY